MKMRPSNGATLKTSCLKQDSYIYNPYTNHIIAHFVLKFQFLPRDASAERGNATVSRLSV